MIPNITSIPKKDLISRVKPLSAMVYAYEEAVENNQPAIPVPSNVLEEREQIRTELGRRQSVAKENRKNLQWDVHHFAEDVYGTMSESDDGEHAALLIEGLIRFRKEFGIQSCNACRQTWS